MWYQRMWGTVSSTREGFWKCIFPIGLLGYTLSRAYVTGISPILLRFSIDSFWNPISLPASQGLQYAHNSNNIYWMDCVYALMCVYVCVRHDTKHCCVCHLIFSISFKGDVIKIPWWGNWAQGLHHVPHVTYEGSSQNVNLAMHSKYPSLHYITTLPFTLDRHSSSLTTEVTKRHNKTRGPAWSQETEVMLQEYSC